MKALSLSKRRRFLKMANLRTPYVEVDVLNYALAIVDKVIATALSVAILPVLIAMRAAQLALDAVRAVVQI